MCTAIPPNVEESISLQLHYFCPFLEGNNIHLSINRFTMKELKAKFRSILMEI